LLAEDRSSAADAGVPWRQACDACFALADGPATTPDRPLWLAELAVVLGGFAGEWREERTEARRLREAWFEGGKV
jgi:hypothetical protein